MIYFFLRRRKRRALAEVKAQQPAQELPVTPFEEMYYKDPNTAKAQAAPAELGDQDAPPAELHGDTAPQELPRHPDQ